MIDFFENFGGKKYLVELIAIILIFFFANSFFKNKFLRIVFSIFTSLLIVSQFLSLYSTNSFIGYQFYIHANLRDVCSLKSLFSFEIFVASFSFLILLFLNFFSTSILKKILSAIRIEKIFHKNLLLTFCILSLVFLIISGGNFISDSKTLTPLFVKKNKLEFKEVLFKYGMTEYITPDEIVCEAGKNIIVISMESLEKGFLSKKHSLLTPNLINLKNKWNYYAIKPNFGSSWTSGSLYTYLTGFPAFFGYQRNMIFKSSYHSNISSISHVLSKANYSTIYLNGNADHAGVKEMLNIFQFDKVLDYKNSPLTGLESKYGLRDFDLFQIAKKEINNFSKTKVPFAMFISTTDTHFPNGIYDNRMESVITPKKSKLEFTVASLDYMIGDFINFLESKDVLKNTSIFIFPDHLKMGNASVLKNTGSRGLFVLTNTQNKYLKTENLYQINLPKMILEGSDIKHNLKFLCDFIKSDVEKFIEENILSITEINTHGIFNSQIDPFIKDNVSDKYLSYKNDTSRFIAHAGGSINGHLYTNSKEALEQSYAKGFRLFELDIITTSDDEFVAAHDWKLWSKISGYKGKLPPKHEDFISYKIYGKYNPLDIVGINKWFNDHKDAVLITDKINDPIKFSNSFIDKSRLMMELFDEKSLDDGLNAGILSSIPSQEIINNLKKNEIESLSKKGVKHVAISRKFISKNKSFLNELKKFNIKAYVFGINNSNYSKEALGVDEEYVVKYEMDFVYGIYADNWDFNK